MPPVPPETRAQVARRRLAELAANFDASLPDPHADGAETGPPTRPPRVLRPVHVRLVAIVGGVAAVLTAWWLVAGRPHEVAVPDASTVAVSSTAVSSAASAPAELVVDVAGRVRRPGIVTLPPGSRVHEAITAAGGVKGDVDTAGLNLARVLTDGEQVLVGAPVAAPAPAGSGSGTGGGAGPVNLNSADLVALDTLPGVGPVTAEAIVAWREENGPFRTVDDLLEVKGIGEATLAELRDHVTV